MGRLVVQEASPPTFMGLQRQALQPVQPPQEEEEEVQEEEETMIPQEEINSLQIKAAAPEGMMVAAHQVSHSSLRNHLHSHIKSVATTHRRTVGPRTLT